MATTWTTELRVGLFVLVAGAAIVVGNVATYDGVRGEPYTTLHAIVESADGLWPGSPVRLAGVEVGAVQSIEVSGDAAAIEIRVREPYVLPSDTTVELRTTGMLGDRYVTLRPGASEEVAADGDTLASGPAPLDLDALGRQAEHIAAELDRTVVAVQEIVANDENRANLEQSLADLAALTATLAAGATETRRELQTVLGAVHALTEDLRLVVRDTSPEVAGEMEDLRAATQKLDAALEDLASITDKIDRGEGTLGALVNDRALLDQAEATLGRADAALERVGGVDLHADAYTLGRLHLGSPVGDEQPWGTLGTLGAELGPSDDLWFTVELTGRPVSDAPGGPLATVLLSKRLDLASLRLGMRESAESVGLSAHLADNRVRLDADAFDFSGQGHGADRPLGVPDLRLGLRAEPLPRLWLDAGVDEVVWGLEQGFLSPYAGIGVHMARPGSSELDHE